MICSHCQIQTGHIIGDAKMPRLCPKCYNEFQKYWLEWMIKKFPPNGGMPMWYVTWSKAKDRGKLCREWNIEYSKEREKVIFT